MRCDGNVAEICESAYSDSSAPLIWHKTDCGDGVCLLSQDASPRPFCALSDQPDPRCATASGPLTCDADLLLQCYQGYATSTLDCITGASEGAGAVSPRLSEETRGACVTSFGDSFCAQTEQLDPRCPAEGGYAAVCDNNQLLECQSGHVLHLQSCPSSGSCVSGEYPFCSVEAAPEPLCPPDAAARYVCREGLALHCHFGWVDWTETCGEGTVCTPSSSGGDAFCLPK
jgi:hypothetical protein